MLDTAYKNASSKGNLVVLLARKAFTIKGRRGSNCEGDQRHKKTLSPRRLKAIKAGVRSIYPIRYDEEEKNWWRLFKGVINESCRRMNRYTYIYRKF